MHKLITPNSYASNLGSLLDMTKKSNITGFRDLVIFMQHLDANGYYVTDNSTGKFYNFSIYKNKIWQGKIKIVKPGSHSTELDTKLKIIVGCKDGRRNYVVSSFKSKIENTFGVSFIKTGTKQMMFADNITHGLSLLSTIY